MDHNELSRIVANNSRIDSTTVPRTLINQFTVHLSSCVNVLSRRMQFIHLQSIINCTVNSRPTQLTAVRWTATIRRYIATAKGVDFKRL